jgi:hypothetical protein
LDQKLREILQTASTALIFGALLGGVVKLLLDQVERGRERRDEQLRFITSLLADLKSVYDRVERVRILVDAHCSAKTYGDEMRDLIDSAVQLRNVERALDSGTSGLPEQQLGDVRLCIRSMEKYLNALVQEFATSYKPIADKQRVYEAKFAAEIKAYEARFAAQANEATTAANPIFAIPDNYAWQQILTLPKLQQFRHADSGEGNGDIDYRCRFVAALDLASWVLRNELQGTRGVSRSNITEDLTQVRIWLKKHSVEQEAVPRYKDLLEPEVDNSPSEGGKPAVSRSILSHRQMKGGNTKSVLGELRACWCRMSGNYVRIRIVLQAWLSGTITVARPPWGS